MRDTTIFDLIAKERQRQVNGIELIASENFASEQVMEAQGSVLTNKYAEGYPGKRYYGGCEIVDVVEDLARDRAKELYGAAYVNVQPHSGSPFISMDLTILILSFVHKQGYFACHNCEHCGVRVEALKTGALK